MSNFAKVHPNWILNTFYTPQDNPHMQNRHQLPPTLCGLSKTNKMFSRSQISTTTMITIKFKIKLSPTMNCTTTGDRIHNDS